MNNISELLMIRLEDKGIELNTIPSFIRNMANSIISDPHMDYWKLSKKLDYLGWTDIDFDYQTFQLAKACIDSECFESIKMAPGKMQ